MRTGGPEVRGAHAPRQGAAETAEAGNAGGAVALAGRPPARGDDLERLFGDPADPGNPLGFDALLAAEKRGLLLPEAVALLTDEGFGAELVPASLGGRLERADTLARMLRPVFRRDVALGFGHGLTSLFAATAVWAAGTPGRRAATADLLCGGGRLGIVHHEHAHGSAVLRGEIGARRTPGGYVLDGRKDMVVNADIAGAFVVYARTAPSGGAPGGGGRHSVLLLDRDALEPGALRTLGRRPTAGLRGCHFAGLEFTDCAVPADTLVGAEGDGVRLALRGFPLNRALIPAAVLASVDTALRAAVRTALTGPARVPGGRHRALLAGVFAELLACDAMTTAALRAVHLAPADAHLAAAAVKYLLPDLLREDVEALTTVLASGEDARTVTARAMTAKLLRDLPAAGLGHAGTAACQAVLAPQLPLLARRSWFRAAEPPDALFRPDAELPALDLGALGLAGGEDFLAAALVATAGRLRDRRDRDADGRTLRAYAEAFTAALWDLHDRCRELPLGVRPALTGPQWCALVDRHALVSLAGAVLAVWERCDGTGFTADPAWALLALHGVGRRLGLDLPEPPAGCVDRVLAEVVERFRAGRAYDLHRAPVAQEGDGAP